MDMKAGLNQACDLSHLPLSGTMGEVSVLGIGPEAPVLEAILREPGNPENL